MINPQKATVIPASYDNSESSRTTDLSVAQNVDNDMESILYRKANSRKEGSKENKRTIQKISLVATILV